MKTKYVCRGLTSLYVNFHNNWTMWSTNLHVKICRWGGKEKEPNPVVEESASESRKGNIMKLHKNCSYANFSVAEVL